MEFRMGRMEMLDFKDRPKLMAGQRKHFGRLQLKLLTVLFKRAWPHI